MPRTPTFGFDKKRPIFHHDGVGLTHYGRGFTAAADNRLRAVATDRFADPDRRPLLRERLPEVVPALREHADLVARLRASAGRDPAPATRLTLAGVEPVDSLQECLTLGWAVHGSGPTEGLGLTVDLVFRLPGLGAGVRADGDLASELVGAIGDSAFLDAWVGWVEDLEDFGLWCFLARHAVMAWQEDTVREMPEVAEQLSVALDATAYAIVPEGPRGAAKPFPKAVAAAEAWAASRLADGTREVLRRFLMGTFLNRAHGTRPADDPILVDVSRIIMPYAPRFSADPEADRRTRDRRERAAEAAHGGIHTQRWTAV